MHYTASNFLQVAFITELLFGLLLLWGNPRFIALRLYLGAATVLMALNFLEETHALPFHYLLTPSFTLLEGPLFYWVVSQLVFANFCLSRKSLLHLLPAFISLLFNSWPQWVLAAGTLSQIIYFYFGVRLTQRYAIASEQSRSDAFDIRADWIRHLLWLMIAIAGIDAIRHNLQPHLPSLGLKAWYFTMQFCYFLMMGYIIIRAVRAPAMFSGLSIAELSLSESSPAIGEQQNKEATHLFNELNALVEGQHLYRTPRLSLKDLAVATGLNEKDISWAVNCGGQTSFNDYINALRLTEVSLQLSGNSPTNAGNTLTVLDIAFAAGFNSKSSFNTVFKNHFGVTPSQYQSQQR
ncbi:helix-turn-helix domain-containing protein [Teredinibacter franksiae]|uniref:helix-turn-helix domain-containing protein n=1 Tax=Teredinibacter franksiae TaxID=2761453 RepID=UPI0016264C0F|nr:AraC family transcriptional regulator [Teredinibacter franksiae]